MRGIVVGPSIWFQICVRTLSGFDLLRMCPFFVLDFGMLFFLDFLMWIFHRSFLTWTDNILVYLWILEMGIHGATREVS